MTLWQLKSTLRHGHSTARAVRPPNRVRPSVKNHPPPFVPVSESNILLSWPSLATKRMLPLAFLALPRLTRQVFQGPPLVDG